MWYAMVTMDYQTLKEISADLGIGEYYRYLPLLFTYRTINTTKPLGGPLAEEERKFLRSNDEINLEKVGFLMEVLPTDLLFIFKAMHIIGTHNSRAGGTSRERMLTFT
jgi:aarF domain-containing kinase